MIYDDKIIGFFTTALPVGMSLVIIQDHCLSSKIDTILVTIYMSMILIHLMIVTVRKKSGRWYLTIRLVTHNFTWVRGITVK